MMTPQKTRFLVASALTVSALCGTMVLLSACGKQGSLETAPPFYGEKAKAHWAATHSGEGASSASLGQDGVSISSSSLSGGGNEATLEPTATTKKETEKAKPDANGQNVMLNPYTANVPVSDAPLEGTGNAQTH